MMPNNTKDNPLKGSLLGNLFESYRDKTRNDVDTMEKGLLEQEEEATNNVTEGGDEDIYNQGHPSIKALEPNMTASPKEERQLMQVIKGASDFIYGDNMDKIVRALNSSPDLFESAGEAAKMVIKAQVDNYRGKGKGEISKAVLFSQDGAIPMVLDQIWAVARQAKLPGADDPNQYAAALINIYKKFGEQVIADGDDDVIGQAEAMAIDMTGLDEGGMV